MSGVAGLKCDECGHAMSRHNELNYCRHRSKRDGDCCCGLGIGCPSVSDARNHQKETQKP